MSVALYKLATQENREKHSGLVIYPIDGKEFIFNAVEEDDVDEMVKDGWSLTTTDAGEDKKTDEGDEVRQKLIDRLNEAGVKFHPNSKTETLQAKVDELD